MLYPLRFQPLFRDYLWGGRRLATLLGKQLPDDGIYAESWEIVDHGDEQSRVLAGPLAGQPLRQIVQQYGRALFGVDHPPSYFPWLLKFLDAEQMLSIQVHPNDQQAAAQRRPDRGKTEAWVIMYAEPGSFLYAGLQPGVDARQFQKGLEEETVAKYLHRIEPRVGDCIFLPAGTVHALGAGLVVAEIQQSSDTTYRLHDWNRRGPDGQPRALHVADAMRVIDFDRGPAVHVPAVAEPGEGTETLVDCHAFILQRRQLRGQHVLPQDHQMRLLAVVAGEIEVSGDPVGRPLRLAETILIPARCDQVTVTAAPAATVLQVVLPHSGVVFPDPICYSTRRSQ